MFLLSRKFTPSQEGKPGTNNKLDQDLVVSKRRNRHRGPLAMSVVLVSTQIWYVTLSNSKHDSTDIDIRLPAVVSNP